jgi:hypothetical protein
MAVASDITLPVFGCRRAEVYVSLGALISSRWPSVK